MNEKQTALLKLSALDFAIWELKIYLDTHPGDRAILNRLRAKLAEREALAGQYEARFGPLTASESTQTTGWSWIADPWPWEKDEEGSF